MRRRRRRCVTTGRRTRASRPRMRKWARMRWARWRRGRTASLTLNAPTTPGTYYYGACADAVADETNTANNCSAAVALTVREPPPGPDLAVTAMLSDAVVDPGRRFRLAARVSNKAAGMRRRRRCVTTVGGRSHAPSDGGLSGRTEWRCRRVSGSRCRVADANRRRSAGHVLLRCVRGRGGGRVGHVEQLLAGDTRCPDGPNLRSSGPKSENDGAHVGPGRGFGMTPGRSKVGRTIAVEAGVRAMLAQDLSQGLHSFCLDVPDELYGGQLHGSW